MLIANVSSLYVSLRVGAFLYQGVYHGIFQGLFYLQNLLVQLHALALDEIASGGGHFICQVPQSAQGELQSGVHHSNHGFLLHDSQQLL